MSAFAIGVLLGQLASVSPPGYRGILSLADRSEVRAHSNIGLPDGVDFETIPTVVADLSGHRSDFLIGYGPRFAWIDVTNEPAFAIMHTGRFSMTTWSKHVRFTLSLNGSIGLQNVAGLGVTIPLNEAPARGIVPAPTMAGSPAPSGSPAGTAAGGAMGAAPAPGALQPHVSYYLPPATLLYAGSFGGGLAVTDTFSRRWTGSLGGYYAMAGGLDFPSQQVYPPTRGGGGDVLAAYTMSRQDAILSHLHSEYTYVVTTNDRYFVTSYLESIRHTFSLRTVGTVGAGVSVLVQRLAHQNAVAGAVAGAGEATIIHTIPLRDRGTYVLRAAANLGQQYNPYLGIVQLLGTATASSAWTRDRVSVAASVAASTSLPIEASDAARVASGMVIFGYEVGRAMTVQTGVRGYAQLLPSATDVTYPPQWVVFVALLLAAPPMKF